MHRRCGGADDYTFTISDWPALARLHSGLGAERRLQRRQQTKGSIAGRRT